MRIAITKKPVTISKAHYALLASGMTSGVWAGEEDDSKHESLGKPSANSPSYDS
jgi:hypothetical protein